MPRLDPSPEALLEFVGGVARARSVDELQTRYLAGISDLISGFAAGMYVLNPFRSAGDSFAADSFAAYGVSDFFLSRYEETGRTQDPVLANAVAEQCAVDNRSLMTAALWRSLPVYEEIFQLHHMTGLLEAPLLAGDEIVGTLNFGRSDSEGPFTARERALAEALARLVSAASERRGPKASRTPPRPGRRARGADGASVSAASRTGGCGREASSDRGPASGRLPGAFVRAVLGGFAQRPDRRRVPGSGGRIGGAVPVPDRGQRAHAV